MRAIEDHLEHLRLLGHSDTTIYGRMTFLRMLGRWLDAIDGGAPGVRPLPEARATRAGAPGPTDDHTAGASSGNEHSLLTATPEMLARWRAGLAVSDDVIVHYVCHAREFYRWAVTAGILAASPAEGLPVPRQPRRLPRPIGEPDLMRALALAPPRIRPWLVLAGWCGLRAKEIAYLRRENVLDAARPPYLLIADGATKGHAERVIPVSAFVLAELQAARLPASGYAFRRRDGRRGPNSPGLVSQLANEHLHACGIPETLHQLRHRFGTQAYRARKDLRVVQHLMGHLRPESTALYVEFSSAEALAAVEALPVPRHLRPVDGMREHG